METNQVTHKSKKLKGTEIRSRQKNNYLFIKDYNMPFQEPDGRVGRLGVP